MTADPKPPPDRTKPRPGDGRRVVLYARQSIEKEGGDESLSIESQVAALRARAGRERWQVVAEERDSGLKGWQDEGTRPGLAAVFARCEAGGVDDVLVWDLSRLARSLRIQENTLHRLALAGAGVVSLKEPHASMPLFRQILGAIAEEQTRTISAHVRRAIESRMKEGKFQGAPPLGYRRGSDGRLVANPDRVPLLEEIVRRVAAGESYVGVADDLNARGVPTERRGRWHASTIRTVVDHETYRGVAWGGSVRVEGAHEALVDAETWARLRARIDAGGERAARRSAHPTFLRGGLARCGCGAKLYPIQRRRTGDHTVETVTLRCATLRHGVDACAQPVRSVSLRKAESFVAARLAPDLEEAATAAEALAEAEAAYLGASPDADRRRRDLDRREKRAAAKRDRADDAWFAGDVERATWQRVRGEAIAELAATERERAALPNAPDPAAFREAATRARRTRRLLRHVGDAALGEAMRAPGAVLVLRDGGLALEYDGPMAALLRHRRDR